MVTDHPEIKVDDNVDQLDVAAVEPRLKENGWRGNRIPQFASDGSADTCACGRDLVPAGFVRLSEWMEARRFVWNEKG